MAVTRGFTGRQGGTRSSISVEGVDEIVAELEKMKEKLARKVIREAIKKGNSIFERAAEQRAPVLTGNLVKSIESTRPGTSKKGGVGRVKAIAISPRRAKKGLVSYAAWVEFGTKYQPPKRYMTKAFDANDEKVIDTVVKEIQRGLGF